MIKAVKTSLILILLCGGSISQARAQAAAAGAAASAAEQAEMEAVRRQANTIQMRKTIDEARAAKTRNDITQAIQKYEAAWTLSQGLINVEAERGQIAAELVPIRLDLAKKAQSRGDLKEADTQIRAAQRVAPTDEAVLKLRADNDQRMREKIGQVPSEKVLSRKEEFRQERVKISTDVHDAQFLMEQGRLDEAEKILREAVKTDPENRPAFYYLDLIKEQRYAQEARKREIGMKDRMVDIEKSWTPPTQREMLPTSNPFARTNEIFTSTMRQRIYHKLETIMVDNDDIPVPTDNDLSEVLRELARVTKDRDLGGKGVNFIINQAADRQSSQGGAAIDPATGLPVQSAAPAELDVEKFRIKFDPPMRGTTLKQFLDALVMVAKPPTENASAQAGLKYSVEDYAIVFSQRNLNDEPEAFFTRTFRLDPNTFKQGLEGVVFSANPFQGLVVSQGGQGGGGGGGAGGGQNGQNGQGGGPGGFFTFGGSTTGGQGGGGGGGGGQNGQGSGITFVTTVTNMATLQNEIRSFFTAAGVDFPTNQVGGAGFGFPGAAGAGGIPGAATQPVRKAMFYNDRTGVLFVRATLRDLDIIENALHALNVAPSLISIEAKFAEFTQNDNKGMGFQWFLGNTSIANGNVGVQGGTAPSVNGANPPATVFPNPVFPRLATDQEITSGLRQTAPTVATMTGILTNPQFRVALNMIENRQGVDLLSAPTVTTVSGRQARISVEETRTIIVGLQVQGLGGNAGVGGAAAGVAQ